MAESNSINLPGGFGGLMRYNEEYESIFNIKPSHVIVFVVFILLFRLSLPLFI